MKEVKGIHYTPIVNDSIVFACITAKPSDAAAGKDLVSRKRNIVLEAGSYFFEDLQLRVKLLPGT